MAATEFDKELILICKDMYSYVDSSDDMSSDTSDSIDEDMIPTSGLMSTMNTCRINLTEVLIEDGRCDEAKDGKNYPDPDNVSVLLMRQIIKGP